MPSRSTQGAGHKMVLVLRGELRLTAGKAAVQAAHAAVMLVGMARTKDAETLRRWESEGQKKIALVVPTLSEMEELQRRAKARGLLTVWVEDAGFTEVPPGTRTCLGIGPARVEDVDPLTGDLPLL
ncbi:MAG: aminoacyl-tRNA hydrolase [Thermoplasmata archaeon]|jgi:peptidyl-tRNA hydrolase, PTH2 family